MKNNYLCCCCMTFFSFLNIRSTCTCVCVSVAGTASATSRWLQSLRSGAISRERRYVAHILFSPRYDALWPSESTIYVHCNNTGLLYILFILPVG